MHDTTQSIKSMGINDGNAQEPTLALSPKAAPTPGAVAGSGVSFTPGPWTAETYLYGAFEIVAETTYGGCLVITERSRHISRADEMHANARLIAAAPELYEALRELSAVSNDFAQWHEKYRPAIAKVRAALARAVPADATHDATREGV